VKSKVIISKEVLIIAYNIVFAKWNKAKGMKKKALELELESLKINQKLYGVR
jgi:hypothetical protein